ncbi:MAG: hypothetical protein ABI054_13710 [Planctomycetota bacterium]
MAVSEGPGRVPAAPTPASTYPIHGSLSSSYRARTVGGDHDHDLTETLSLDFGDAAKDAWTGHVMTRLNGDIDGGQNDGASHFHDLNDIDGERLVPRLYDAWIEGHAVGPLETLRLGRQTMWDTPVFAWFDGASALTNPVGARALQLGIYAGVPVHPYESSSGGDSIAGAYAQAQPWKGGRGRLDWMHLEDRGDLGSHSNDLWRASVWQAFGKQLRADGWFTGLEGEERDWFARVSWANEKSDFTLSASWFQLLTTQQDLAPEIDPFFTTLFELFPYRQARLLASKDFNEHVNVQLGIDTREVDDSKDVGRFNRDSDREFATLGLSNLTAARLDLSLTGENWNGDGSDIQTWGFDVTRRFGRDFRASIGSYYALFKVDSFLVDERDHVRTGYFRLRWHRTTSMTWDLRYEVEDADDETFHFLRVGMTWAF